MVRVQQVFGTDNHYIQDEGCGHEIIIICALWPVNSGENTVLCVCVSVCVGGGGRGSE